MPTATVTVAAEYIAASIATTEVPADYSETHKNIVVSIYPISTASLFPPRHSGAFNSSAAFSVRRSDKKEDKDYGRISLDIHS